MVRQTAWVPGYRFESTGINSGDTIGSAYLQLVSSDGVGNQFCLWISAVRQQ